MAALPLIADLAEAVPAGPILLRSERATDFAAREALLDEAMGPGRTRKASEAIRRGRRPAEGLSLVAESADGWLTGSVRLWPIAAGQANGRPVPALLLGPLAVRPDLAGRGIGAALMRRALTDARARGHAAVVLVGDAPYYERFGFDAAAAAQLVMPGPFERHRLLAIELAPGALAGASGLVVPTGRSDVPQKAAAPAR